MNDDENEYSLFVGVDWGSQWHEVCVIRPNGRLFLRDRVRHTGEGLAQLATQLRGIQERNGSLAVAMEVPHGPVVETLVEAGFPVFAINPKQSDRFRDRHTVAGAKDDRLDAFVLADALRTDLPKFRLVAMPDPTTVQLREITRWREELNGDLRRCSNRLWGLLQRYFPAVLELCPAADEPWFWEILSITDADPAKAKRVRTDHIARVLRRHRKRAVTVKQVRAAFRAVPVQVAGGTVPALAMHVKGLLAQLETIHASLVECEQRLAELVEATGRTGEILDSHPGIGTVITGVILAEAHGAVAERDLNRLRAQTGVAAVTRSSGKTGATSMRRACNHRLRWAVRQWAFTASRCDPYARALYDDMKARGLSHERALRGVGDRLLARLIATLREDALYDPARHRAPGSADQSHVA